MKKPGDLIIPFPFEERRPVNIDSFFLVPDYYDKHDLRGFLDFYREGIFPTKKPVNIEYCSGNGQWIVEKAINYPYVNWIAVEYLFARARKIWVKKHNLELNNLFIVFGEASLFTKYYLKEDSISNIFINFPDPWPKKRHQKNRLVTSLFMDELSRVVQQDGIATLVTDDEDTQRWMAEAALLSKKWKALYDYPYYVNKLENYGSSYFDALFRAKGKEIRYLCFANSK